MRVPRPLRIAGWTLAAVIVVLAGFGLAVLAINGSDRPPSKEALELAAVLEAVPDVPDEENGYVYMLGFAATRDADPWSVGVKRASWIRRLRRDYSLGRESDPYPGDFDDVWAPEQNEFFPRCPSGREQRECFAVLAGAGADVDAWLAEHRWVLDRYEALLRFPSWQDIETYDHRKPRWNILAVVKARNGWYLEAWSRAARHDAEGVREMLRADLEFWRRVLAEAGSLFTKVVAASMVESHFERSNIVLKRLPADRAAEAVPASWRVPISETERSLKRAFAAELESTSNVVRQLHSADPSLAAWPAVAPEPPSLMQRLDNLVGGALLQHQDFVNKVARGLAAAAEAVEAPYSLIPERLARARELDLRRASDAHWAEPLYNPIGDRLRRVGQGYYFESAARVADLEGIRRAALLTAELRSRGVGPDELSFALENAELNDPYTGEPFDWAGESGEVVFNGIGRRHNGRHAFWY